jgi:ribosome-binding protein aMBF1 (putative translation factor)
MGTERTRDLQQIIEDLIARVGWSRKALARQLHWELNDTDDEDELKRFEERLKKELTRSTTKPELLEHYLDVIRQLHECEKAGLVVPQYIGSKHLDSEIEEALRNISSDLSTSLRNKNPD